MKGGVMTQRVLTGIRPSGQPHLGNYLGMIRPALDLAATHEAYYFIADYHALTTVREPAYLRRMTLEVAAAFLSLGLDPQRSYLYRQSDVPEVFELSCLLSNLMPKGALNRGHAYKAAVQENRSAGKPDDEGINAGTYYYPVLMTADILAFEPDVVPVGEDNRQHIEIARDVTSQLNHNYRLDLRAPEGLIQEEVATIIGLDGRRMSASYGNTIPIFAGPQEIKRKVMSIVTDSRPPEESKNPETDPIFTLFRHFGSQSAVEEMRSRLERGGISYKEAKERLADVLIGCFEQARARYSDLMARPGEIRDLLHSGAKKVRPKARTTLMRIKEAVGIAPW
jgi:tryptophanyl-tRNA synthetase